MLLEEKYYIVIQGQLSFVVTNLIIILIFHFQLYNFHFIILYYPILFMYSSFLLLVMLFHSFIILMHFTIR